MSFLITPPHKIHGLRPGCGYTSPPLDGSLTVPEIYDFNLEHNPSHPVFVYPNGASETTFVPFSEVVPAAHEAGRYIASAANIDLNACSASRPTIGILAASDTITFFTTILGALRAEIPVFLISYRNSVPGVAHLLSKVQVSHLLVSCEPSTQVLAQEALDELRKTGRSVPGVSRMPAYDDIYLKNTPFIPLPVRKYDYSAASVIIHSSGTSSFPKPIIWSPRTFLQAAVSPHLGIHDLCGEVLGGQALAMFHAIGVILLSFVSSTGMIMATFAPASPATIPTPDAVYQGLTETRATYTFVVPSFIEAWSQDEKKISLLSKLKGVLYSGGPLNKGAGDRLTQAGATIYNIYGLSEVSLVASFLGEHPGKDWEFFSINPHCAAEFVRHADGSYEAYVVSKPTQEVPVVNAKLDGKSAYATGDLLLPHPTKPGFWKIFGRADEQIMLSTGEKTNPGPLEGILRQHPQVAAAVMFGRGRFQNGVLLELKSEYQFDPTDTIKLSEFRETIWSKVEELNAFAPTHSRLFKEMILVSNPNKPFKYSAKKFPKRAEILREYEEEINTLYASVDDPQDPPCYGNWTLQNSLAFVRAAISNILQHPISDDQDIFESGCDSLQATWIRRLTVQALKKVYGPSIHEPPLNFIYDHPTIVSLAKYVYDVTRPETSVTSCSKAEELEKFVRRYTASFPTHTPASPSVDTEKDIILVTGTTGSLGSAILAELIASESVEHIYAYNRRNSQRGILERQEKALKLRGYDQKIASSPKLTLIEGDLTSSGLGLNDICLEKKISATVTHIIHGAWRVDFNLTVASFATAIGGVRGLIDIALSSPRADPPRLIFISSIGVLRNIKSELPVAELPVNDPNTSVGQGYSESKWVGEQILYAAAKSTPLQPVIVRVGQISGGINGAWNTSDWVPAIIRTSVTLGKLPRIDGFESCSWVNLHLAGKVLTEIRHSRSQTVHLVHPRPARWNDLIQVFSRELKLPLVPYAEWMDSLVVTGKRENESPKPSMEGIPAFLLLDFLNGAMKLTAEEGLDMKEIMGTTKLSIDQGRKESRTLNDEEAMGQLGEQDVCRWLGFWKSVGYIV